uniref:Uncharacterized protein n=1 Tax=Plectus sambesii TaxID=2011161 RepID=A0A914V8F8_9BILA
MSSVPIFVVCFCLAVLVKAQIEAGTNGSKGAVGSTGSGLNGASVVVGGGDRGSSGSGAPAIDRPDGGNGGGFGGRGFGGRRGGFGRRGGGGGLGMRRLSFFNDLDETVKQKFRDIMFDHSLSRDEKKLQLDQLAQSALTPTQLTEFKQLEAQREERMKERREEMDKKIAALSPNVRKAAEQIRALWQNGTARGGPGSWRSRLAEVDAIKAKLSDTEKKELDGLWPARQQWKAKMDEKIAALSPNARKAAEQIRALRQNHSLDWSDKRSQIRSIKANLTEAELTELEGLRGGGFGGRRGGGRFGGRRGGWGRRGGFGRFGGFRGFGGGSEGGAGGPRGDISAANGAESVGSNGAGQSSPALPQVAGKPDELDGADIEPEGEFAA